MAGEIFFDNGGSGEAIKSTLQPGSLAITLYDFNDDGSNSHVTMTPAEWDAFVAAGDRALGRKPARDFPPGVVRRARPSTDAEIVARMADLYRDDTPIAEALERAALAMVREAGPTVPRAALSDLLKRAENEATTDDALKLVWNGVVALLTMPKEG